MNKNEKFVTRPRATVNRETCSAHGLEIILFSIFKYISRIYYVEVRGGGEGFHTSHIVFVVLH